jgi:hypothetical protein
MYFTIKTFRVHPTHTMQPIFPHKKLKKRKKKRKRKKKEKRKEKKRNQKERN